MNLEQIGRYTSYLITRLSTFISLAISLEDIEHKKTVENILLCFFYGNTCSKFSYNIIIILFGLIFYYIFGLFFKINSCLNEEILHCRKETHNISIEIFPPPENICFAFIMWIIMSNKYSRSKTNNN